MKALQASAGRQALAPGPVSAGLRYVLFEDEGQLKVGEVLSEAPASVQLALPGGRRLKVKMAQIVMRLDAAPPATLLTDAEALCASMDVALLWEFAPADDVGFELLASDYFGDKPSVVQRCAMLLCLQAAPIWFQRRGRGLFRAQERAQIDKALAAVEKRKRLEAQIQAWAEELGAGLWPRQWQGQGHRPGDGAEAVDTHADATSLAVDPIALLVRPDKQSIAYRALEAAARSCRMSMAQVVLRSGVIADAGYLHRAAFAREQFPRGLEPHCPHDALVAALEALRARVDALPLAAVRAFSVDDSSTTEIDDALSVQWHAGPMSARLASQTSSGQAVPTGPASQTSSGQAVPWCTVGVHIAVPCLLVEPGNPWDQIARERMSTVYAPGEKIQMLPEAIVRAFSLDEGGPRPALSLYLHLGENYQVIGEESRLEQVPIHANLRHDRLEECVTEEAVQGWWEAFPGAARPHAEAEPLLNRTQGPDTADRLPDTESHPMQGLQAASAHHVEADPVLDLRAELALLWRLALHWRATREEQRGRPEARYRRDFQFRIDGDTVEIVERMRDTPLDRIVAECMILANARWARQLALNRLPGIFRSQQMGKARMTTHPMTHQGLGVSHYIWATSPLRRYADLVNQRQLLALATRQRPPFVGEDTDLHAVIAGFDARYDAYAVYQERMERFWSMRWVEQGGLRRHLAVALREQRVRLVHAPLVLALADLPEGFAGRRLWIEVLRMDWVDLAVEARMLQWDEQAEAAIPLEPEEG